MVPVPQVDRDRAVYLPKVSVPPTKSFTFCLSDSFPTQESVSPEINYYQEVKQSTEKNQSDTLIQSIPVLPNAC